jgi:2-polyprenyl-3-methyl-5-hydroxy-6-metoxy-1,4-benzoquinol methylase
MSFFEVPSRLEVPPNFGSTPSKVRRSFRELRRANRYLGGTRSILEHLRPFIAEIRNREIRALDVGSGAGDIPQALALWARKRNLRCQIVALDRHADAAHAAHTASIGYPEIQPLQGDGFTPPFNTHRFDFVLSSMMLHYFSKEEAAIMLSVMAGLANRTVIVADVERHWIPHRAIHLLSALFRDKIIRKGFNDTVLRGFTREELGLMAEKAGFSAWCVYRHFPFRLVLVGQIRQNPH